jgi:hypothetical protein
MRAVTWPSSRESSERQNPRAGRGAGPAGGSRIGASKQIAAIRLRISCRSRRRDKPVRGAGYEPSSALGGSRRANLSQKQRGEWRCAAAQS